MSVSLTHPESKGSIEVDEDRVDVYLSQGWERKGDKKSDK